MRVSRAEMDRSHARIVESAARIVRERGVAGTAVAEVMEAAGLTHGGFYRHFASKDALVESAIGAAFAQMQDTMERNLERREALEARAALHGHYLSDQHLGHPGTACPVATLGGDVAHAGPALRKSFGRGVDAMLATVSRCHQGTPEQRQRAAMREFAMLVGAAVIARATDADTAQRVLAACRPLE